MTAVKTKTYFVQERERLADHGYRVTEQSPARSKADAVVSMLVAAARDPQRYAARGGTHRLVVVEVTS